VIVFRDCLIEGQDDCHGSGARAASFFAQALSDKPRLNAVPIPRPADPTQELSDDAAVANAKDKGYDYVVNGEVMDYYYAHQPSLQRHRAALAVRVLRTSDGQVVYSYTGSGTTNNLSSPIAFIQDIAVDVQNALLDD
jgi:hypothetical protein